MCQWADGLPSATANHLEAASGGLLHSGFDIEPMAQETVLPAADPSLAPSVHEPQVDAQVLVYPRVVGTPISVSDDHLPENCCVQGIELSSCHPLCFSHKIPANKAFLSSLSFSSLLYFSANNDPVLWFLLHRQYRMRLRNESLGPTNWQEEGVCDHHWCHR